MDIMTYHYKIENSDVSDIENYLDSGEFQQNVSPEKIKSWTFTPRSLSCRDTIALAVWIFQDLGILGKN